MLDCLTEPVQTTATYKTNDNNITTATDAARTEFENDELYKVIDDLCSINKYNQKITPIEKKQINKLAVDNDLKVLGPNLFNKKSVIIWLNKEIKAKNERLEESKKLMTNFE